MNILDQTFRVLYTQNDVKELPLKEIFSQSEKTLIYFYPKNDTPWCTLENQDFTTYKWAFEQKGIALLGVSRDSVESHDKFCHKYGLQNPLLSDPDWVLHQYFWAWGEKNNYGKKTLGVIRSSFLLDNKGHILQSWKNVKATWHVEKVLRELKI